MKKFIVQCTSITGITGRTIVKDSIIDEVQLIQDHIPELITAGAIAEYVPSTAKEVKAKT
jgi:hypothetical protein